MECPECKYQSIRVTDSRKKSADIVERRRECTRCGLRFVTQEKIKNLTKSDGKSYIYVA